MADTTINMSSRLPRPASSPVKATTKSMLPPPPSSTTNVPLASSNTLASKRKAAPTEAPFQPASKRATVARPASAASSITPSSSTGSSSGSSSLRSSQRAPISTTAAPRRGVVPAPRLAVPRPGAASSSSTGIGGRRSPNLSASTSTTRPPSATGGARSASGGPLGRSVSSRSTSAGPQPPAPAPPPSVSLEQHEETNKKVNEMERQMQEFMASERNKISSLETAQSTLKVELATAKSTSLEISRSSSLKADDHARERAAWARDAEDLDRERRERIKAERLASELQDEVRAKKNEIRDLEEEGRDEKRRLEKELDAVKEEARLERKRLEKVAEVLREELESEVEGRKKEREEAEAVKRSLSSVSLQSIDLSTKVSFLQTKADALEVQIASVRSDKAQVVATTAADVEAMRIRVEEAEQKVREGETERRKLHNQIQELKGNIRVFCRVRPPMEVDGQLAVITYPDREGTQIVVSNPTESAMGATREQTIPFAFDKVFQPSSTQEQVFEEISALTQSVLDGYNCCIFAYGQTGAGKSFTMEGGNTPESSGMIPRAIAKIFDTTERLKEQGWVYELEGQFLEIYNETLNDLLGTEDFDKKKHEIKHEKIGRSTRTTVTDATLVPLKSPNQVRGLLERARGRRAVAATLMNERSSRSHSVFSLRVSGSNPLTGESCEGVLNLVDLAGSERLASSGAGDNKDRLKETININKSLSALADVIGALGSAAGGSGAHVPYRNSKLTYLLQTSLSGQSKTLMVLNLSPLAAHMPESLCSLRFATKVNSTQIGTAKKTAPK
ncbi:P-loop containing nucleoside triphosphate hydrolase protein [Mrakia frigida]|uniref:P-loop containing nucleoside triphosphate hydrolase protein n=1 Tax=Mrakia frigida TaxID=29902 RepID=UPI003FCC224E